MYLVALTGGGTLGHVTPNLALIENLPNAQFIYIGSGLMLEKQALSNIPNLKYHSIATGKLRRYFSWQNFVDFFKVPIGFFQALKILSNNNPNLLFSKGGYVSLPVVLAAYCLKIPIIIHESDSIPGLTTKIASIFANEIWANYDSVINYFPHKTLKKVILPVRKFLSTGDKNYFKFDDHSKPTLLVMGGSLGAKAINDFVFGSFEKLISEFNIIHICGNQKTDLSFQKAGSYYQFESLTTELGHAYKASDFVLSRAGASAISELLALNKKSVLVPLPTSSSRGEQFSNAHLAAKVGACVVVEEEKLDFATFMQQIRTLKSLESHYITDQVDLPELLKKYMP